MEPYYAAIRRAAAGAVSASDKQDFLKAVYEDFYTAYNPKDADRLGIVYTPSEVVRYIIGGCDTLSRARFGKALASPGVDILDPCAGTGTFEVELVDFFRGDKAALSRKFATEVHSNEISILPYYIASLNVERALAEALGSWQAYTGACFVNTLDNWGFRQAAKGAQQSLLGQLTDVNYSRIQSQNSRIIPIIVGNPPYSASQKAEDDNNKNQAAPRVDARIKETYLKESNATKTKLYDPYVRFFRWSSDRIGERGIVAFITNRGYLDKRGYDGFRKSVSKEFQQIWVVDLKGDVRDNPRISGSKHNIFGIQTGVAIVFLVRDPALHGSEIRYLSVPNDFMTGVERLRWLSANPFESVQRSGGFAAIEQNVDGDWLNQPTADWSALLPMGDKKTKAGTSDKAIFKHYSLGVSTNRDAWVYDASKAALNNKAAYLAKHYNARTRSEKVDDGGIKWSRNLKRRLSQRRLEIYSQGRIRTAMYRPFVKRHLYDSNIFVDESGSAQKLFPVGKKNLAIGTIGDATPKPFSTLATRELADLNFISPAAAGTKFFPLYTFSSDGTREDNITEWASREFRRIYHDDTISKTAIFHYVYAVLHDPVYRETFSKNLRKSFPRIPFYADFATWSDIGRRLMCLHTDFEKQKAWPLRRVDKVLSSKRVSAPRMILRASTGKIEIDNITVLLDVPDCASDYMLGNRSAVQWVLDLFKANNPTNRTGVTVIDNAVLAPAKEEIIRLVAKVCRISVETSALISEMEAADRSAPA